MRYQSKAFQLSLLVHGTFFAGLVLAGLLQSKEPPALVIDFSLNLAEGRAGGSTDQPGSAVPATPEPAGPQPQAAVTAPPPTTPLTPKAITPRPKKPIPQQPKPQKKKTTPRSTVGKESAPTPLSEVSPPPSPAEAVTEGGSSALSQSPASPAAAGGGVLAKNEGISGRGNGPGGGNQGEGSGIRYDFTFVRDRILKNLHFPATARQQGRTGKIVVSFNLLADGQVERIRIVSSSGHDILDQAVIDTIRQVAPFPKPPISAQLVLPIVFHLK